MPLDPNECLENAMRCRKLATETTDPGVQEILIEVRLGPPRFQAGRHS